MNPILGFFTALISPVTEIVKSKQALKKAVTDSKIDSIKRGEVSDIDMDNAARTNAGWMDDVSFFVFLLPAVLAFYPPALPHIAAGFKALELMPQWYQLALGMMLVSVWGYRKLVGPIIQSIVKSSIFGKK